MQGIVADIEPNGVNGFATLLIFMRFTWDDRLNGDLTWDRTISVPVQFINGNAKVRSSADVSLNQSFHGIPPCAIAEIQEVRILYPGSRQFARPGLFMP